MMTSAEIILAIAIATLWLFSVCLLREIRVNRQIIFELRGNCRTFQKAINELSKETNSSVLVVLNGEAE